jgi:hypothetical protein
MVPSLCGVAAGVVARAFTKMNKYKLEARIQELVTRAGVVEPVSGGQRTLASEPIRVFYGTNKSSFEIFDQYGHAVGNAKRIPSRYSRDGYQYRYELGDTEPRFTITDISKGRWVSILKSFAIAGPRRFAHCFRRSPKKSSKETARTPKLSPSMRASSFSSTTRRSRSSARCHAKSAGAPVPGRRRRAGSGSFGNFATDSTAGNCSTFKITRSGRSRESRTCSPPRSARRLATCSN